MRCFSFPLHHKFRIMWCCVGLNRALLIRCLKNSMNTVYSWERTYTTLLKMFFHEGNKTNKQTQTRNNNNNKIYCNHECHLTISLFYMLSKHVTYCTHSIVKLCWNSLSFQLKRNQKDIVDTEASQLPCNPHIYSKEIHFYFCRFNITGFTEHKLFLCVLINEP